MIIINLNCNVVNHLFPHFGYSLYYGSSCKFNIIVTRPVSYTGRLGVRLGLFSKNFVAAAFAITLGERLSDEVELINFFPSTGATSLARPVIFFLAPALPV